VRSVATALALVAGLVPIAAVGESSLARPVPVVDGATQVTVELDKQEIDAGPGQKIKFVSRVRNAGDQPLTGLIAHLNILSSDPDVYVDPEDWSPRRTQYIGELAAGDETALTWKAQAVTAGPLILYVAVTDPASDAVAVSGPLHMTVGGRRLVNSGGVLPLVTAMPAAVMVLLGLTLARRRRRR